ncbi:TPA: hypothetical protein QDA94_003025 [Burkholderia vietnamiensis]|nr:hypothetical protein [Burkholderia vietnamiensis]HDR9231353.1 hypothetical protein [Burkholderia vietnamiensis]
MNEIKDGGPAFVCTKCGVAFEPRAWQVKSRDRRCLPCKRAQQNATNSAKGQRLRDEAKQAYQRRKAYYAGYWTDRQANPEHVQKRAARRKVATEIEAGRLLRRPCEVCGAEKADAHHDDYSKPLEIQWLCHSHHMLRHAMLRARGEA